MSKDPKKHSMNERQWADYVAERKSGVAPDPSDQLDAASQQVYDLEVDSSLRGLAEISSETKFVDKVMKKVNESNSDSSNPRSARSLPTVAPAFKRNSDQAVLDVPDKCLVSANRNNATPTTEPEATQPQVPKRNRVLAIACGLALAAVPAYFLLSSRPIAQPQNGASQQSPAGTKFLVSVGKPNEETLNDKAASEDLALQQLTATIEQTQGFSSPQAADAPSGQFAEAEAAVPAEIDWASGDERAETLAEINLENKPQLSTDPLPASDDLDQPLAQDQADIPDLQVASERPPKDHRILQSEKAWDMVLSIDDHGVGNLTINSELVSDDSLLVHSPDLIRAIGNEAAKRMSFVQPQIGKQIGGSVTIGDERYDFEAPVEIAHTIEAALVHLEDESLKKRLAVANAAKQDALNAASEARRPAMQAYMETRRAIFELVRTGRPIPPKLANLRPPIFYQLPNPIQSFTPLQNARHRIIKESLFVDLRYSPSTDELIICEAAVIQTETFLRGLAKEKLLWNKQVNRGRISKQEVALHAQSLEAFANETQINNADFKSFALAQGELAPPVEEDDFKTKSLIQHLSGMELKSQLHATAHSYDLFEDVRAFRSAINFVNTNIKDRKSPPQRRAELFEPLEDILSDRPDLQGLPLVMGKECRLSDQDAKIQSEVSKQVGRVLARFDSFGNRSLGNDTFARRQCVESAVKQCSKHYADEGSSQGLVTLDQMMQIDHTRLVLDVIENLHAANTDTAIELLAKRAKFDLRPEVRFSATQALKEHPKEKYRSVLLKGFEYPWYVVAQHSAEALVRLDDTEAVPELVELLKQHKTLTSFEEDGKLFQKEVVSVNHLRNCLLCHAPSLSTVDPSRGQVPDWELPLPRQYYQESTGTFVRADVTYLTQDFSVVQPVDNPGAWPANQRFDYMVYKRPVSKKVAQKNEELDQNKYHREAIVFALRSLTGQTPEDDSWENWGRITNDEEPLSRPVQSPASENESWSL